MWEFYLCTASNNYKRNHKHFAEGPQNFKIFYLVRIPQLFCDFFFRNLDKLKNKLFSTPQFQGHFFSFILTE